MYGCYYDPRDPSEERAVQDEQRRLRRLELDRFMALPGLIRVMPAAVALWSLVYLAGRGLVGH